MGRYASPVPHAFDSGSSESIGEYLTASSCAADSAPRAHAGKARTRRSASEATTKSWDLEALTCSRILVSRRLPVRGQPSPRPPAPRNAATGAHDCFTSVSGKGRGRDLPPKLDEACKSVEPDAQLLHLGVTKAVPDYPGLRASLPRRGRTQLRAKHAASVSRCGCREVTEARGQELKGHGELGSRSDALEHNSRAMSLRLGRRSYGQNGLTYRV